MKTFDYNGENVRTIIKDGEPLFALKDICKILGISDSKVAARKLDEDEGYFLPLIDKMGREQNTMFVTESGFYHIVLKSNKPNAKPFRKWVTSEVLK